MRKISKKYTFALIGLICQFVLLFCVKECGFSPIGEITAIASSQLAVIIIVVTYLTGEAKIDVTAIARASYGKSDDNDYNEIKKS